MRSHSLTSRCCLPDVAAQFRVAAPVGRQQPRRALRARGCRSAAAGQTTSGKLLLGQNLSNLFSANLHDSLLYRAHARLLSLVCVLCVRPIRFCRDSDRGRGKRSLEKSRAARIVGGSAATLWSGGPLFPFLLL